MMYVNQRAAPGKEPVRGGLDPADRAGSAVPGGDQEAGVSDFAAQAAQAAADIGAATGRVDPAALEGLVQ
jgi:hypothetical protein